ncbi:MAG: hypothetical protein JWN78_1115 [Bacteroidota bacterium]|nr:hypothetical protein [Bacteroidota bacterium]
MNFNSLKYRVTDYAFIIILFCLCVMNISCQKKFNLKYENTPVKQVILANLTPGNILSVNISKSKQPDDFNPVEFLSDCKVDLYENDVFKETLTYKLKDTLSGLGNYVSSFHLIPNKTYHIVSLHPQLGTANATEYLPPPPKVLYASLDEHANLANPQTTGRYSITFWDSAGVQNYYLATAFYKILKPVVDSLGDTSYVNDHIFNIPSYSPEIPNPSGYSFSFFTDAGFDGQFKILSFTFPSQYNNIYREITFIVQLYNVGKNYYDWNIQQIPVGQDFLNEGQQERANLKSNIENGYGHFTASSGVTIAFPVK